MKIRKNCKGLTKCKILKNSTLSIIQPPPPSRTTAEAERSRRTSRTATPFNARSKQCTAKHITAFTLAETLLTLMIIGVVAALTIPALNQNLQRKSLQSSTKKAFSTLNQGLDRLVMNVGYTPRYYYKAGQGSSANQTDKVLFWREFPKAFNVTKYCANNAYSNGCIPAYKGNDTVAKEENPDISDSDLDYMSRNCGGFSQSSIRNSVPAYVLADNIIIFPYNGAPIFNVDVNGKNGPNKWGYDIFSFILVSDGDALWFEPQMGCKIIEKGGTDIRSMLMK